MKLSTLTVPAAALTIAIGLTGCGGASSSGELATTKSQTQLVRNEAAQRLISGTDESVAEQQDYSEGCKSKSDDPEGLYRSWHSTLLAAVPKDSAVGVDQFVAALATSFSEDGWTFTEDTSDADSKVTTLTRSDSPVTITVTSTESTGVGASIFIMATGRCVLTGGPESDEVKGLEKQK